jgi:hypothetical protein
VSELAQLVAGLHPEEGARRLRDLIAREDELLRENRLKPYEDSLAPLLAALPDATAGPLLDALEPHECRRALFGNYARIPDARLRRLLAAMAPGRAAEVVAAMAVGIDAPREMGRVLGAMPASDLRALLECTHPAAVLRILREMPPAAQVSLMRAAPASAAAAVVRLLLHEDNRVLAAWASELVGALEPQARARVLSIAGPTAAHVLGRDLPAARLRDDAQPALTGLRLVLAEAPVPEAAMALAGVHPSLATSALRMLGSARAASLLCHVAETDAELAADLLEACNVRHLARPPRTGAAPSWWLEDSPAAAIVEAIDLDHEAAGALLGAVRPQDLRLTLEHVSPARRDAVSRLLAQPHGSGELLVSLELMRVGRGTRRTRAMDGGVRWVHIEEELDTGEARKPVILDLLEMRLDRVRLRASMAVSAEAALPAAKLAEVFEDYRQTGRRPGELFAALGLAQLSPTVREAGALAAVNGNFYFDYGHYINGVALGIEMARVPGLFFGDPIGWYVEDGRELVPPAFNRTAGIATDDGRFHIDRVFMTAVRLPNGRPVHWDALNAPKVAGRISAYNSVFGARTERADSHVDIAIARGRIWAIDDGGDQVIPLTGFSLAIPRDRRDLLDGLSAGAPVEVANNLPAGCGRVLEAMACGPSLVRDGAVDIDFETEDFGQQDSSVMSFFLPRWVETYQAARSFMALRGDTLILGAVSGTAYGWGRGGASAGMTFGELAQLCRDLDVDRAYALDGGGSSSLIAREHGEVRILNTPTGGADVTAGEERYINTSWLVFARD